MFGHNPSFADFEPVNTCIPTRFFGRDKADQAPTPPPSTSPAAPKGFVLEDGTPVKLRTNRTISSGDAQVGDTLDFES